jgi:3-deoxy-D-manno-octulosonate 8-phosphate phosphatase KdsC-like HAD superfamily phosphatase
MQLLGLPSQWLAVVDKVEAIRQVSTAYSVALENICFVGDGPEDVALLRMVGIPCSVRDGCTEAVRAAQFVTQAIGGAHAIAEIVQEIMSA